MPRLLLACAAFYAFPGAAFADPAPIVYAGQAQSGAAADNDLLGGGANSYGYGEAARERDGAMIDLRRAAQPAQPAPVQQAAEQPDRAQPWLERERVGPPYQAGGRWYVPTPEPGYSETGRASWYGPQFHGRQAANGEIFDQEAITAAHPTLPLNSLVQVTNLENGRELIVRVTDRGPFVDERLIDLSHGAAVVLGFERAGGAQVHVRYLGPAPRRVDTAGAPAQQPVPAPATGQGPLQLHPTPAEAPGAYMVQVGAFADLDNATKARVAVETVGLASVDARPSAAGELYRVRVGPFASVEEAAAARAALAELGYSEAIIAQR